jgi:lysophospholipase L1-like esterase
MRKFQHLWLLVLFAILPTSLLTGAVEETHRIKGESASPIINSSGDLVYLFKNQRGGLSKAWQNPSSGKYTVKEVLTNINVSAPVSKMDRQGIIWAIWEEGTENNNAIVFAKIGGKTGVSPRIISPLKGYHFSPDFCFDSANIAWLTWGCYAEGRFQLLVKEMKTQSTWLVNSPFFNSVCQPKIAADATGKIWVFWSGTVNGKDKILSVYWDGNIWSTPSQLNTKNDVPHILPNVSLDANGLPWVTWCSHDGHDYEIFYSSWNGREWSQQDRVTNNTDTDVHPSLSFTTGGIPVVVWSKSSGGQNVISCRYKHEESWSREITLYSGKTRTIRSPKITIQGDKIGFTWQTGSLIHADVLLLSELVQKNDIQSDSAEPKTMQTTTLDENKYIGFGDSITYGMMNYEYTPELGYIPRLESLLWTTFGTSNVINEGWPGELTHQGEARMSAVLEKHKARYLLLMEGTNDVIFNEISMDTTAYNLEQMLRICRDKRVFPILSTIIPRKDYRWNNPFYKQRIFDLNDKIRDLAKRDKVAFIDMFDIYFLWPENDGGWRSLLSNDHVHPNQKGYQAMAESWLDEIQRFPFPAEGFWVARHHDQVGDSVREANGLGWQDSYKIRDKSDFRAYRIYRAKIGENPLSFKLLKALPVQTPEVYALGVISFPNCDNFERRYLDVNIEYLSNYKYTVTLVRKDGVEGPPSNIGQDISQGGSEN